MVNADEQYNRGSWTQNYPVGEQSTWKPGQYWAMIYDGTEKAAEVEVSEVSWVVDSRAITLASPSPRTRSMRLQPNPARTSHQPANGTSPQTRASRSASVSLRPLLPSHPSAHCSNCSDLWGSTGHQASYRGAAKHGICFASRLVPSNVNSYPLQPPLTSLVTFLIR